MNARRFRIGFGLALGSALAASAAWLSAPALAQKASAAPRYVYKVVVFSYNPGERLTESARVAAFERVLNDNARDGWEPVANLLDRTAVQTVGGAVTSRDTTAFVAFRRPR